MRSQISAANYLKLLLRECAIQANGLIILAATLFIFIIDLNLPLGVAAGAPYVLVVFASLWVSGVQFTYLVASLGIIFAIAGFFLSPGIAAPMHIVFINRGLTLLLVICAAIMVTRIKKANIDMSAIMTQIFIDPLTGYKNRYAFETELDTEILRSKRYSRNLSIAIIDIDLFKLFCDNYDYRNKNDYIKRISQEIKSNIRVTDLFYRIDINVFAILFPETDLAEAKKVCEAIRKKVSTRLDKSTENKIIVSIGIAILDSADNKIDLCKRAEEALFISKRNEGNHVSTLPEVVNKDKPHIAAILSRSRSD
ncbi:GGDEF domain-containing protein [Nitrosomonas sp.]|uniref:GGDEF domain-containing protein n=1 Tax=Nitrosomonas sp. TaxID=42353 RepID=UPI00261EDBCA|nr:GGDEF domain-containing protein [Nitrosomonas sp.]